MNKPIGIMPRAIWLQNRWEDLGAAIVRYIEAGQPIPTEWVDEYNQLDIIIYEFHKGRK